MGRFVWLTAATPVEWHPALWDDTPIGWLITIAYVFAAVLCAMACIRPLEGSKRTRVLYGFLTCFLLAMALNKQLDLQTLLTQLGRKLAIEHGWYGSRRQAQRLFIHVLTGAGALSLVASAFILRGQWRRNWLAIAGLGVLVFFILVRAAYFYHLETYLQFHTAHRRLYWALELGGIGCIAVSAGMRRFVGLLSRK